MHQRYIHDMQQLPERLLQMIAELHSKIEHCQSWPTVNAFACISCLPKKDLDVTNFKLSPGLYAPAALDTRPISIISPCTTVYSGIRFKQMSDWRERWLPKSMHGACASHETHDVSYELQLLLEYAKLTNLHVAGVALDRRQWRCIHTTLWQA